MGSSNSDTQEREVRISAGRAELEGTLGIPPAPEGIVLFAHGSGSSRHSSRNRYVARVLREAGLATLLFDLLTSEEEEADRYTGHLRFNIELLAERLGTATRWVLAEPATRKLPVGYFGASTGGGAALVAAAALPEVVGAVVSRGGRPDLAGSALGRVRAPTLLLVGSADEAVIALNEQAMVRLHCPHELILVPGATHLFEEPGTLEEVARLAKDWFLRNLSGTARLAPTPPGVGCELNAELDRTEEPSARAGG